MHVRTSRLFLLGLLHFASSCVLVSHAHRLPQVANHLLEALSASGKRRSHSSPRSRLIALHQIISPLLGYQPEGGEFVRITNHAELTLRCGLQEKIAPGF